MGTSDDKNYLGASNSDNQVKKRLSKLGVRRSTIELADSQSKSPGKSRNGSPIKSPPKEDRKHHNYKIGGAVKAIQFSTKLKRRRNSVARKSQITIPEPEEKEKTSKIREDEYDVLFYPQNVYVYEGSSKELSGEPGEKSTKSSKTFYSYREIRNDPDYMRLTQKLSSPRGGYKIAFSASKSNLRKTVEPSSLLFPDQPSLPKPSPAVLPSKTKTTKKHPFSRPTRPLAAPLSTLQHSTTIQKPKLTASALFTPSKTSQTLQTNPLPTNPLTTTPSFSSLPLTQTLSNKLAWNRETKESHIQRVKGLSKESYTSLLESSRQWREKTKRLPVVIKRKKKRRRRKGGEGGGCEEGDSEGEEEESEGDSEGSEGGAEKGNREGSKAEGQKKRKAKEDNEFVFGKKAEELKIFQQSVKTTGMYGRNDPHMNAFMPELPSKEERESNIRQLRMAWYPRKKGDPHSGFVVDSKEGRSCVMVNDLLYMFGGYSPATNSMNFQTYDIFRKKMGEVAAKNRDPPARAFHTCNAFNHYIVIFGGELYSRYTDSRLLTNEVLIFNTKSHEYLKVPFQHHLEPRKFHASVIIGPYLVISGGIDENGVPLSGLNSFNLSNLVSPLRVFLMEQNPNRI